MFFIFLILWNAAQSCAPAVYLDYKLFVQNEKSSAEMKVVFVSKFLVSMRHKICLFLNNPSTNGNFSIGNRLIVSVSLFCLQISVHNVSIHMFEHDYLLLQKATKFVFVLLKVKSKVSAVIQVFLPCFCMYSG